MPTIPERLQTLQYMIDTLIHELDLADDTKACPSCNRPAKKSFDDFQASKVLIATSNKLIGWRKKMLAGEWQGRKEDGTPDPTTQGKIRRRSETT